MIDATAVDNVEDKHQAIGVMSTVGLFMVNAISAEMINSDLYAEGCIRGAGAYRLVLAAAVLALAVRFRCVPSGGCCTRSPISPWCPRRCAPFYLAVLDRRKNLADDRHGHELWLPGCLHLDHGGPLH